MMNFRKGLGAVLAASMLIGAGAVAVSTSSADVIIMGRGSDKAPKEKPEKPELGRGHSPERGSEANLNLGKCPFESEMEDMARDLDQVIGTWHKDKDFHKNIHAYPIVTGTVDSVTGTTFTLLGGNVIVDASRAMVNKPCWRVVDSTPIVEGEKVLPLLAGDRVYVRGRLLDNGTIAARSLKIYLPETDGVLAGIAEVVTEDGVMVVNDQAVLLTEQSVILKACGCEPTTVKAGDAVRVHVLVLDLDGDGTADDLAAAFVRVLRPAKIRDAGDDSEDEEDDEDDSEEPEVGDDSN